MPSSYSTSLKFELQAAGENNTTWGTIANTNWGTTAEEAIVGSADVTFASANVTLTLSNSNASQTARNMRLVCVGTTGGATRELVVPSVEKLYIVKNECLDTITVKTAAGTGVDVLTSKSMWLYCDATNVVEVVSQTGNLTVNGAITTSGGALTIADGTVSAPSLSFASDTDVGFYRPSANTLGAAANSTRIMLLGTGTNIAFGSTALDSVTSATSCIAIGRNAGTAVTSGDSNVFIGDSAGDSVTTGNQNTIIGSAAGITLSTGTSNTFLGTAAGSEATGTQNTIIGHFAAAAGAAGSQNTLLGASATGSTPFSSGTNNTVIGYAANPSSGTVSNTITLGNSSITTLRCQVTTITSLSDERDKADIQSLDSVVPLFNAVRPVTFNWAMRDGAKVGVPDVGFIAQELVAAQAASGIEVPGLVNDDNPDMLEVGALKLFPYAVKAIQELIARVEALEAQLNGPN